MGMYRKKPVVIEALLYTEDNHAEVAAWCGAIVGSDCLHIETLEGTMTAHPGSWIIKGVQGEFYPCAPAIFDATYEEVV